jgi:8-oxo-dGTP pyrophosphatase MutT (NUDIX family)
MGTHSDLWLLDTTPLRLSDSVGVVIKTTDERYLLQHRSTAPGLYFPDFWGLFGGGVKDGELPIDAAIREFREELQLTPANFESLFHFTFDLSDAGLRPIGRWFFLTYITASEVDEITLTEGQNFATFTAAEALSRLRLVHYDAFAIWVLEERLRLT